MNPIEVLIDHDYEGERVDKYLSVIFPDSSRAALQKAVEAGNALINGKPVAKNYRLRAGDRLSFSPLAVRPLDVTPENIPLDIAY